LFLIRPDDVGILFVNYSIFLVEVADISSADCQLKTGLFIKYWMPCSDQGYPGLKPVCIAYLETGYFWEETMLTSYREDSALAAFAATAETTV